MRETVRRRYAEAAASGGSRRIRHAAVRGGAVLETDDRFGSTLYTQLDRNDLPVAAVAASLGCGNPTAVADLRAG